MKPSILMIGNKYSLDGTLKPMPVPFIPAADNNMGNGGSGGKASGGAIFSPDISISSHSRQQPRLQSQNGLGGQRPRSRSAHHSVVAASSSSASTQFSGGSNGGRLIK